MFAGPIVFAVFIVTSSFAEESSSNDVPQEKRAPMGFQGMRGKKDVSSSENDEYSKRAPMGFQGMRGKKIMIGPDIEDNFSFENSEKRAPSMGFQGMRGKKEYLVPIFEDPYYNEEFEKRAAMMGFQGMRGKKTITEDEFNKRGPMGFQGVRGKKSLEEILEDLEKRARMGFHGTRGKKSYYDYPEDFEKRALAMGFQGMRGKRQGVNEDWEKRAPMGFQGMRGKKDSLEEIQELQKRAIMGFQGVRGKRDIEHSSGSRIEVEKRNLLSSQGPMRDREDSVPHNFEKRSPFWYFGSRGKKNPRWEFRGKFVGVRGKKWAPEDQSQLKNLFDNIERLNRLPGYTSVLEMQ